MRGLITAICGFAFVAFLIWFILAVLAPLLVAVCIGIAYIAGGIIAIGILLSIAQALIN